MIELGAMLGSALSRFVRKSIAAFLLQTAAAAFAFAAPPASNIRLLRSVDVEPIAAIVQSEIEIGRIPGAVIEIGQGQKVIYRRAFGDRELEPRRVAMTPDTIFDLASLTKPVATTVAIMQLHEAGQAQPRRARRAVLAALRTKRQGADHCARSAHALFRAEAGSRSAP